MSQQRSLEQQRATRAWEKVTRVRDYGPGYRKEYGQLARSAPADIQTNGLGQYLAFLRAKRGRDKQGNLKEEDAHYQLLAHISEWVMERLSQKHAEGLLGWIVDPRTSTDDYRRATAEAMAFLAWLKRFAEADLGEGGSES